MLGMLKMPLVQTLYSQGTSSRIEDGFIVNPPFLVVIDAYSSPYHPQMNEMIYDVRKSGGEKVKEIIMEVFSSANPGSELEEILAEANKRIYAVQKARGIPIDRADLLAGAAIVAAKIEDWCVEIIQAGDCRAIWIVDSGMVRITENQVYLHDREAKRMIARLMKKYKEDRGKMWMDFYDPLCKLRLRDQNQEGKAGFAVVNGQPGVFKLWKKLRIPMRNLRTLFLISDGIIELSNPRKDRKNAQSFVMTYMNKGLPGTLEVVRGIHKLKSKESHITYPEATAIAASFED